MNLRQRLFYALLVAVVFVGAISFAVIRSNIGSPREAVAVHSSGRAIESLDELVDNSELVVIARAVAVTDGRTFASGSAVPGIRSQLVRLEVGAVLAGATSNPMVMLEEEATTSEGAPLIVDGLRPTRAGDQGFFFLIPSTDNAVPYYATVSTLGRYLRQTTTTDSDVLSGAREAGPLASTIVEMGGRRLTDAVIARARATGRPLGPLPQ